MALGNNASMGQARGKNKPVVAKRATEVYNARNFTEIISTTKSGVNACALSLGNNSYYHNGSGDFPAVNDKVYSKKQASTIYVLENGHYKMHRPGMGRVSKNIEIGGGGGAVSKVSAC
tara:strand:+ start:60 stop:413 length:354 start_codon:yes stop_codon:yes gene_type:complete